MRTRSKISLAMPGEEDAKRYFSFKLKQNTANERSEYPRPKKLFVVSDIEGNFRTLCKLLFKARVIDRSLHWVFEDGHLVVLGDCFDRGEEVTECLWLIYSLEEKARKAGGDIHFILGNHEIMNMNGDWRYVHPKYAERKSGNSTALYSGNNELWRWLGTKNIVEKSGDILFVHGGIAPELVQNNLSVKEINDLARRYYSNINEAINVPMASLLFDSNTSPFWYRGYYIGTALEEQIDSALRHFGVKTIVTGHTVLNQVTTFFNGKVININTDHASGNSQGLLISKDRFYRLTVVGNKDRIK